MTLTPVKTLPKRAVCSKNDIEKLLQDFVSSCMKIARVDYSNIEYESSTTLRTSLYYAIERSNVPVRVCIRNHQVYLIKL